MGELNQVADGVWVRQSEWVWTNSIVVRADDGLVLIDPGIERSELDVLADDLDRLGIPVVAGFSTHPHWDHLLWHDRFGDVPRYATAAGAQLCQRTPRAGTEGGGGGGIGRPSRTDRARHPAARGRRARARRDHRASGALSRPRRDPPRRPWRPARRRHALRHPDPHLRLHARTIRWAPTRRRSSGWARPPGQVDVAVPGHGAVAEGPEVAARIAADRAYIDALRRGEEPVDARLEAADWLSGIHQSNLEQARGR